MFVKKLVNFSIYKFDLILKEKRKENIVTSNPNANKKKLIINIC